MIKPGSWRDDRRNMSRARVVVSPHGGAVANLVFAPAGASLIELISSQGLSQRPCYYGLAHSLGFSYDYVEPVKFDFYTPMTLGEIALAKVSKKLHTLCEREVISRSDADASRTAS